MSGVLIYQSLPYSLETQSLSLDIGWPTSHPYLHHLCPPAQELQEAMSSFVHDCLGFALQSSNSNRISTLSMEPSSQPPPQVTPGRVSSFGLKPGSFQGLWPLLNML